MRERLSMKKAKHVSPTEATSRTTRFFTRTPPDRLVGNVALGLDI
jgi:hypothetical protein